MKVAVLGAGIAGLVAGRRLAISGHECEVYERWPGLGGQVATLDVGDGHLLERYYHHLFTSDAHIVSLYDELGMGDNIEWLPSSVAVFANGKSHPFTTPFDLIRFSPMSVAARIRMGLAVLRLQRRGRDVEPFEGITAEAWVRSEMGEEAWGAVWGPLLRGKFGDQATEISMAWLWSKLTLRRQVRGADVRGERLGYPRGGWQPLLECLRSEIEDRGGRVLIDEPAKSVAPREGRFLVTAGAPGSFRAGHDPRAFSPATAREYDAVLATVPGNIFTSVIDDDLAAAVGHEYLSKVRSTGYQTALCLLLELDRQFSPYYWTNVADNRFPFIGLIEQTNLIGPQHYGGRRFLYVANYLEPKDPLLDLGPDELVERYGEGLRLVNPDFSPAWIRNRWLFSEPAAQPIVTLGYRDRIPPLKTPVSRLVLANTTQIYPEDRGTNYSVRLGEDAASTLIAA